MKKLPILIFCVCVIFSSVCFAENREKVGFVYSKVIRDKFPSVFRPVKRWLRRILGVKIKSVDRLVIADLTNVILSRTEIMTDCSVKNNSCTDNQLIEISTEATNPDNSVLIFEYQVSSGKIIGQGAKVIWDLSGVKPGTYTITAGVDNGCGICGTTKTMEVKVVECPNCK
jgi:hypothetical protein